jgi:putative hemolysin
MKNIKIVLATAALVATCSAALAYQQFDNATIQLDGKNAGLPDAASAYCVAKGFKGAESYTFDHYDDSGNTTSAVFAFVRCTHVAGVVPFDRNGGTQQGGGSSFSPNYNSDASRSIADAIANNAAVKESISNSISKGYKVN